MLFEQISPRQSTSVKVCTRKITLKFGKNWVSYSGDIADMDKCHQDKCDLDIWHLVKNWFSINDIWTNVSLIFKVILIYKGNFIFMIVFFIFEIVLIFQVVLMWRFSSLFKSSPFLRLSLFLRFSLGFWSSLLWRSYLCLSLSLFVKVALGMVRERASII